MSRILTPLELPAWLEFNQWRTGLKPYRFCHALSPDGPEARAVLYLDRRGRVKMPRGNPYLSVSFESARQRSSGRTADWHRVAAPLVDEMRRRGSANQLYLPPEVDDVRPWQWQGFFVSVRYTYYLDFPLEHAVRDRATRRHCDRADALGLRAKRVDDVDPVIECLAETEARQGFSQGMGRRELSAARDLLGDEHLRMYVCFDAEGRAVASHVILHAPGARAISWMAGALSERLRDGASHLVWRASLDDVSSAGASGIDLCGANMASIAAFKSHWGGRLVTNYGVRTYTMRTAARIVADWLDSRRLARVDTKEDDGSAGSKAG